LIVGNHCPFTAVLGVPSYAAPRRHDVSPHPANSRPRQRRHGRRCDRAWSPGDSPRYPLRARPALAPLQTPRHRGRALPPGPRPAGPPAQLVAPASPPTCPAQRVAQPIAPRSPARWAVAGTHRRPPPASPASRPRHRGPPCAPHHATGKASQFLRRKRHSSCAVLHATPLRPLIPLCLGAILHL